ncbi:MAG: CpaF family protein [Clostridia bacterium]|nr:CpaF family protein [Clostridia bacterium]
MPLVRTLYEPAGRNAESMKGISVPLEKLVMTVTDEIIRDKPHCVINAFSDEEKKAGLKKEIIGILDSGNYYYSGGRQNIINGIFDFMFGYGALQKYVDDDEVSDIDGTSFDEFSITKNGIRRPVDVNFGDDLAFGTYCRLVAIRSGGFLNEDDTHCRTADLERRLRINVSIPPRNISGPAISIRKHRRRAYAYERLEELGMLDAESTAILKSAAESHASILFSGKGAAGKTTLLRTFLNSLPELERVLVVESDAEIYPEKKFCIQQRTKKPGEGGRPVDLEMLIRDGLTMSLDTYCVGEIVGAEAYSFIMASRSGHRVLGTIHSSCAEESLNRLVSLAAGARFGESAERMLGTAADGIDHVVHLREFKVESIISIEGMKNGKADARKLYERKMK